MPRIFVGNIPHGSSQADLQRWIESRGFQVDEVEIIYDRVTGKSRGFGFVTLTEKVTTEEAINLLNRRRMEGRVLTVNEATPLRSVPPSNTQGNSAPVAGREL